ncbi:MAG: antitoxin VapB family protein [Hadesarchaea archaeon]|nr:antitoxin VapB family protein [Hadesarchaea archaeon]
MKKDLTTIAVRLETKRRLERYRVGRESYDELVNRLLEETLPRQPPTLRELKEMRKDEYIPLEEVLERLGL